MTTRADLAAEICETEKQIDKVCETLSDLRSRKNFNKGIQLEQAIEFWENRLTKLMDYRRNLK